MFVEKQNTEVFLEFLKVLGVDSMRQPSNKMAPDYLFEWRGGQHWIYLNKAGLEVFGDNIQDIEKSWRDLTKVVEPS